MYIAYIAKCEDGITVTAGVTDVSVGTEDGEEWSKRHDSSFYNCKRVNK
jgi:hypothetical protein